MFRSRIVGVGHCLPRRVVSNFELMEFLDTSDAWIQRRSGISQRYWAEEGELTSCLATTAASEALDSAEINSQDVDMVVVATTTPDRTFPATACEVQAKLGIKGGFAFDVQAVCSGFVYALAIADNFISLGQAMTAIVIGAETFSRIIDQHDRTTAVLFGDGAGAVVLRADSYTGLVEDRGVLATHLRADGQYRSLLQVDGGPSLNGKVGSVRMEGREVFRHAVTYLSEAVRSVLDPYNLAPGSLDWLVPHQANARIIEAVAQRLNLPMVRVITTIDHHANTSAASVPLALFEAISDGRIKTGNLVALTAMGGGFTWGSALVRI